MMGDELADSNFLTVGHQNTLYTDLFILKQIFFFMSKNVNMINGILLSNILG